MEESQALELTARVLHGSNLINLATVTTVFL